MFQEDDDSYSNIPNERPLKREYSNSSNSKFLKILDHGFITFNESEEINSQSNQNQNQLASILEATNIYPALSEISLDGNPSPLMGHAGDDNSPKPGNSDCQNSSSSM